MTHNHDRHADDGLTLVIDGTGRTGSRVVDRLRATGRDVAYVPVAAEDYTVAALAAGVPPEEVVPLTEVFEDVLDGRNAFVTDGVERVLGRPARDFAAYARAAAATGVWDVARQVVAG